MNSASPRPSIANMSSLARTLSSVSMPSTTSCEMQSLDLPGARPATISSLS
jgi:hypothetical protein